MTRVVEDRRTGKSEGIKHRKKKGRKTTTTSSKQTEPENDANGTPFNPTSTSRSPLKKTMKKRAEYQKAGKKLALNCPFEANEAKAARDTRRREKLSNTHMIYGNILQKTAVRRCFTHAYNKRRSRPDGTKLRITKAALLGISCLAEHKLVEMGNAVVRESMKRGRRRVPINIVSEAASQALCVRG